jgi:hypothetical protein
MLYFCVICKYIYDYLTLPLTSGSLTPTYCVLCVCLRILMSYCVLCVCLRILMSYCVLCVCLRILMSSILLLLIFLVFYVLFFVLFCLRPVSYVLTVADFSGLSILDFHFGFL